MRVLQKLLNPNDMKTITLTIAICLVGFLPALVAQQEAAAKGGCTSVTVTATPDYSAEGLWTHIWGYETNCGQVDNPCCVVMFSPHEATPIYYLQKKTDAGGWTEIAGPTFSPVFENLEKGTYRVRMLLPTRDVTCGTPIEVYNLLGQFLGYKAMYPPPSYYTNEVVVGPTDASDIGFTFIDNQPDPNPTTYDFGEPVKINTSASKNYDLWWLAIFERGPQYNRYYSYGWHHGRVPNDVLDLSAIWESGIGDFFRTSHSYEIQWVVENRYCRNGIEYPNEGGWNDYYDEFFVCPAGSGCRPQKGEQQVDLVPNPAVATVRLAHFHPAEGKRYEYQVFDLTGQLVVEQILRGTELDVSALPAGMYLLTVLEEGYPLLSRRLVIAR